MTQTNGESQNGNSCNDDSKCRDEIPNETLANPRAQKRVNVLLMWCFAASLVVITILGIKLRHIPEPPPRLYSLPEFSLVNQDGHSFGSKELKGNVYIAGFFFTSCPSVCPRLMAQMKVLQERISPVWSETPIRLVSFTVDPDRDTPEVLRAYGDKLGSPFDQWTYLTGKRDELKSIIEGGFKAAMGERMPLSGNMYDLAHTQKLVLVDRKGFVRGYYGIDPEGLDEAFQRSLHVFFEKEQDGELPSR